MNKISTKYHYTYTDNGNKIYKHLIVDNSSKFPDTIQLIEEPHKVFTFIEKCSALKYVLIGGSLQIPIYNYSLQVENIGFGYNDIRFCNSQKINNNNEDGYLFKFNNDELEMIILENQSKSIVIEFGNYENENTESDNNLPFH